jgi:hypothetical protein
VGTSPNRHPVVLLGAAASLITVLGFFGVRGWPGTEPPAPAASTGPAATIGPAASTGPAVSPAVPVVAPTRPATPTPTCACPEPTPTPTPTATTVRCVIEDRLGPGQLAESVTVRFGSKHWELEVDESDTADRLTLRFPRAGSYRYTVETETETAGGDTVYGTGQGAVTCRGGQTFQVVGDGSDPLTVSLEEA